jgi:hypothetical protein
MLRSIIACPKATPSLDRGGRTINALGAARERQWKIFETEGEKQWRVSLIVCSAAGVP